MKYIYEVTVNNSCDGRGPSKTLGFFHTEAEATRAAKGRSGYGSNGTVTEVPLFNTVEDYEAWEADADKRAALAKLSSKEKRLLGLE